MEERTIHLKIKIQSLVDESRNIRKEANKTAKMAKWRLNHHRTSVVRPATRINLLAYGLIRGIPYSVMEKKCQERPDFHRVGKTAKNFGATDEQVETWVAEADKYLQPQRNAA